jgi:hypothetical protein
MWLIMVDLAKRSQKRLMIRLVKGAYWDSEIKKAQIDGMDDYPVFTRKVHTDLSYIACAKNFWLHLNKFTHSLRHTMHNHLRPFTNWQIHQNTMWVNTNFNAYMAWANRCTNKS